MTGHASEADEWQLATTVIWLVVLMPIQCNSPIPGDCERAPQPQDDNSSLLSVV
jgi:hypothetical protein